MTKSQGRFLEKLSVASLSCARGSGVRDNTKKKIRQLRYHSRQ
jgi:hypothetical protein